MVLLLPALSLARVIPPGQEEVIGGALGREVTLPGDCHWDGASISAGVVDTRYLCGEAKRLLQVKLLLRDAPESSPTPEETREFTFEVTTGPAPPGFLLALAQRVSGLSLSWDSTRRDRAGATDQPQPTVQSYRPALLLRVPPMAWVMLVIVLGALGVRGVRKAKFEVNGGPLAALLVFGVAFGLRLLVPWGPLDFAEPERITGLWLPSFELEGTYASLSLLFKQLVQLGVPALTLYRFTGPLLGAVTCALLVPTARAFGGSRLAALIAGLALASWPVHVRYSASANPSVLAAALWLAVLLVMATDWLSHFERLGLLLPLVVLCVYARPEGRFVVLALIPWLWSAALPRRAKLAFCVLGAAALGPYALAYLVPQGAHVDLRAGLGAFFDTLVVRGVTPFYWVLLGVVGWFLGHPPRFARIALGVMVVMLLLSAVAFGSEGNPLWGHWRYLVPLTPLFALGAALAVDALARAFPRPLVLGAGVVLALLPLLVLRSALTRPIDLQEEFQFVLRTAPRLVASRTVALDMPSGGDPTQGYVHFELLPAMALALALGPGEVLPSHLDPVQGMALFVRDQRRPAPPFITYQGLSRRSGARRTVAPEALGAALESGTFAVAPAGVVVDSQCQKPTAEGVWQNPSIEGMALADCTVELSWYEVKPAPVQE